jgi:hypothetical protein
MGFARHSKHSFNEYHQNKVSIFVHKVVLLFVPNLFFNFKNV